MTTTPIFDYREVILKQYANSPTLFALMDDISQWLDGALTFDQFFDYVWNIDTAQGFGLDIWGRILGVGRVYPIVTQDYFGFDEAQPTATPFNQGIFWTGAAATSNYALSDTAYRRLLLAKAMANILDGGTASINQLLMFMFEGRGNAYVVDDNDMSMVYKFDFAFTPVDLTLVQNSGVLPTPAGVLVTLDYP